MNKQYEEQFIAAKVEALNKIDMIDEKYRLKYGEELSIEQSIRKTHEMDKVLKDFDKKWQQEDNEWEVLTGWFVGLVGGLVILYGIFWLLMNY